MNQHILEVLDAIAPPPTEVTFSAEQRVAEAESELKEALVMLQSVKAENVRSEPPSSPLLHTPPSH